MRDLNREDTSCLQTALRSSRRPLGAWGFGGHTPQGSAPGASPWACQSPASRVVRAASRRLLCNLHHHTKANGGGVKFAKNGEYAL